MILYVRVRAGVGVSRHHCAGHWFSADWQGVEVDAKTAARLAAEQMLEVSDDGVGLIPAIPGPWNGVVRPNIQTGASYRLVLENINAMTKLYHTDPASVFVPPAADVPWPEGILVHVRQGGAGQVTLVADAGVTLTPRAGRTLALAAQGATVSLHYLGDDAWDVVGDLEVAP